MFARAQGVITRVRRRRVYGEVKQAQPVHECSLTR